jgi:hypothetical protein
MTLFHPSHKVFGFLFDYFCLKRVVCITENSAVKVLILPKKETLARSARPVPSRVLGSSVGGALKGQTRPIADVSLMRHSQRCAAWGPCQSDRRASREVLRKLGLPRFRIFGSPKSLSLFAMLRVRNPNVPSSSLSGVTCGEKEGEAKFASSTTGKSL